VIQPYPPVRGHVSASTRRDRQACMARIVVSVERVVDTPAGHHDHSLPARRRLARTDLRDLGRRRGIGSFFERMFAPRAMRAIYMDELEWLNAYAREQRPE
jgi:hypothetical protein